MATENEILCAQVRAIRNGRKAAQLLTAEILKGLAPHVSAAEFAALTRAVHRQADITISGVVAATMKEVLPRRAAVA